MELKIRFFYVCAIVYVALQCKSVTAENPNYWPPQILDESFDNQILSRLDSGCPSARSTQNGMLVAMVAETENGFNPKPSKFINIANRELIQLNFDCDNCNPNLFRYNQNNYDATNFQCKTICVFVAAQKHISDACKHRENFEIGVYLKDKYLDLMEACHNTEKTNLTAMRSTVYRKLGFYSRKVPASEENCRRKCMPICIQANQNSTEDTAMSPTDAIKIIDNKQFADNFVESICSLSKQTHIMNSLRSKDKVCNGTVPSVQIRQILIMCLVVLVSLLV